MSTDETADAAAPREPAVDETWPDPRLVCDCGREAKFRCRRCEFKGFCSTDCQKRLWRRHKRECISLQDAMLAVVERDRVHLRELYRVEDQAAARCWVCLESGTPQDPVYRAGCACRNGAMCGHVRCFVGAAAATDPRPNYHTCRYTGWCRCATCKQIFLGYVAFELDLELSRRWDARAATKPVKDATTLAEMKAMEQALFFVRNALFSATREHDDGPRPDVVLSLRLLLKRLDVAVKTHGWRSPQNRGSHPDLVDCFLDIGQVFAILDDFERGIDMVRRVRTWATDTPVGRKHGNWRVVSFALARTLLRSIDQTGTLTHDPADRVARAHEAERIFRSFIDAPARTSVASGATTTPQHACDLQTMEARADLSQALALQEKFDEATDLLRDLVTDALRVYGPDHRFVATRLPKHAQFVRYLKQRLPAATAAANAKAALELRDRAKARREDDTARDDHQGGGGVPQDPSGAAVLSSASGAPPREVANGAATADAAAQPASDALETKP